MPVRIQTTPMGAGGLLLEGSTYHEDSNQPIQKYRCSYKALNRVSIRKKVSFGSFYNTEDRGREMYYSHEFFLDVILHNDIFGLDSECALHIKKKSNQ